jgi:hypothetical protein
MQSSKSAKQLNTKSLIKCDRTPRVTEICGLYIDELDCNVEKSVEWSLHLDCLLSKMYVYLIKTTIRLGKR